VFPGQKLNVEKLASTEVVEIGGERRAGATVEESGGGAPRDEAAIGTVG
jgi:hypothetical protein